MLPPRICGEPMCEKCKELDEKIARYSRFTAMALDPLTTDRIKQLVGDMERIRDAMHPSQRSPAE
jgi:hypothetical protein